MTVQIRLKKKYLTTHKGRYKGGASGGPAAHKRKKLTDVQKRSLPPQPKKALLISANGKRKMITL